MKFDFSSSRQVIYFNPHTKTYRTGIAFDEFVIDAFNGGAFAIDDVYESAAVYAQEKEYDFHFQAIMIFEDWVPFSSSICGPEDYYELLETNYTPAQVEKLCEI